jgi:hypothetical protein
LTLSSALNDVDSSTLGFALDGLSLDSVLVDLGSSALDDLVDYLAINSLGRSSTISFAPVGLWGSTLSLALDDLDCSMLSLALDGLDGSALGVALGGSTLSSAQVDRSTIDSAHLDGVGSSALGVALDGSSLGSVLSSAHDRSLRAQLGARQIDAWLGARWRRQLGVALDISSLGSVRSSAHDRLTFGSALDGLHNSMLSSALDDFGSSTLSAMLIGFGGSTLGGSFISVLNGLGGQELTRRLPETYHASSAHQTASSYGGGQGEEIPNNPQNDCGLWTYRHQTSCLRIHIPCQQPHMTQLTWGRV